MVQPGGRGPRHQGRREAQPVARALEEVARVVAVLEWLEGLLELLP